MLPGNEGFQDYVNRYERYLTTFLRAMQDAPRIFRSCAVPGDACNFNYTVAYPVM